nr:hypothetical protein [Nocardiopsis sp. TSRI0078]
MTSIGMRTVVCVDGVSCTVTSTGSLGTTTHPVRSPEGHSTRSSAWSASRQRSQSSRS